MPAAVICGYLAYLVGGFLNNVGLVFAFGGPIEGWLKSISDIFSHLYLGAAFVYCAIRVAPSAPRTVAGITCGVLVLFAGISLWSSFIITKWYALPAIAGMLFGGIGVMIGAFAGEVVPYRGVQPTRRAP